jgi:hypothetical protein
MGSLRYTDDEVQFGRVIAGVCQDPAVAREFVRGVISTAKGGDPALRRRLRRIPSDVTCIDEQILQVRVGRNASRARAMKAGRVDLAFAAPNGWQLIVELKLASRFGRAQLARYQSSETPVAALVRRLEAVPDDVAEQRFWVGATEWKDMLPTLQTLPLTTPHDDDWAASYASWSLTATSTATGAGPPEVAATLELLAEISRPLLEHFRKRLAKTYRGDA